MSMDVDVVINGVSQIHRVRDLDLLATQLAQYSKVGYALDRRNLSSDGWP